MKKALFILTLIGSFIIVVGQRSINYGDNSAAGKYYSIRGIKMYVEQYGKGAPLLMIHGNSGSISSFSQNIPYFSTKYRVIVTDSRSQGKSIDNKDSLSFEMMADDEVELLDQLHIDSAYVLGWSDGGIVAISMAMRHPGKVIKFAATGANLWCDSTVFEPSSWLNDKSHYESIKNKLPSGPQQKNEWKMFLLDWLQPNISLSELQKIKCPALIIAGDHDVISLEHTVKIYQNIPRANLWIIPNSSHSTLTDHKDEFNKKVNEFFQSAFHGK